MKRFGKTFLKLFIRLLQMEENKYLPPKYSEGFKDLAEALGYNEKTAKSQVTLSSDS